jgi:hypothetical protein
MRVAALIVAAVALVAPAAAACTGVVIARDGEVLVGSNEDWFRPDAYVWAVAGVGTNLSAVYFGYYVDGEFGEDIAPFWYEFQGINEAGLYFDSFSAPCGPDDDSSMTQTYHGSIERLIMQTCETVEEAVQVLTRYSRANMDCMQYLLVDRTGAAAVVERGAVVWKEGETFVLTNFHLSDPTDGHYPCWRYDIATRCLAANSDPTVERVTQVLGLAKTGSTMYSIVCDLARMTAYVYLMGGFHRPLAVDLETLWTEGSDRVPLSSLPRAEP